MSVDQPGKHGWLPVSDGQSRVLGEGTVHSWLKSFYISDGSLEKEVSLHYYDSRKIKVARNTWESGRPVGDRGSEPKGT